MDKILLVSQNEVSILNAKKEWGQNRGQLFIARSVEEQRNLCSQHNFRKIFWDQAIKRVPVPLRTLVIDYEGELKFQSQLQKAA